MKIKIKKLHEDAIIPKYQTEGASGFDLHALETVELETREIQAIRTGLAFEIPKGYELQIRPRSGLSLKTYLRVTNSPGTIDSDYTGEVKIIIENTKPAYGLGTGNITIKKGDRIAQGVLVPIVKVEFEEVIELSETERGSNGFGSSGI